MQTFDLGKEGLRALNSSLHALKGQTNMTSWEVINPKGAHAIAAGVDAPVDITVRGSTGYYCAGMNKQATIRIKGSAGPGVAENMMSGTVIIDGNASQYAGATGRGGLLVVKGNASSRCGVSMKGIDIVCTALSATCLPSWRNRATLLSWATLAKHWATAFMRRVSLCAARSNRWARIASKKRCVPNISPFWPTF